RQARLEAMIRYAETAGCRRVPLLGYFGEMLAPVTVNNALPCVPLADRVSPVKNDSAGGTHGSTLSRCGHCDNCRAGERPVELAEVTAAARDFLACVQLTGECFGAAHLIDVLRGSKSQRVLNRRHDRLPVYGAGRERSAEEWRELARQFIEQGIVEQDLQFAGLRTGVKAQGVLDGEKVFVRRPPALAVAAIAEGAPKEHDPELFEQLRRKRRELADQARVPAYIIFSDRALVEMATHLPRTPDQLLDINGVGEAKLANYGEAFLQLIREHCAARGISDPPLQEAPKPEATAWVTVKRRFEEVGEAFAAGESLDALAARLGVKRGTILQHLQRYCDAGHPLEADRVLACSTLSPEARGRVLAAFGELGHEWLGPVHDALGGSVPYEELHVLRLYLTCRK
ncbi:MAG TPA: RQC domain-containing protein, partial [Verrucomicrobiae bacterium]